MYQAKNFSCLQKIHRTVTSPLCLKIQRKLLYLWLWISDSHSERCPLVVIQKLHNPMWNGGHRKEYNPLFSTEGKDIRNKICLGLMTSWQNIQDCLHKQAQDDNTGDNIKENNKIHTSLKTDLIQSVRITLSRLYRVSADGSTCVNHNILLPVS